MSVLVTVPKKEKKYEGGFFFLDRLKGFAIQS